MSTNKEYLKATLSSNEKLVTLPIKEEFLKAKVVEGGRQLPLYSGTYEVTPSINEQVLETKNKTMKSNVVVFSIPYAEVDNESGGKTATIGLE